MCHVPLGSHGVSGVLGAGGLPCNTLISPFVTVCAWTIWLQIPSCVFDVFLLSVSYTVMLFASTDQQGEFIRRKVIAILLAFSFSL